MPSSFTEIILKVKKAEAMVITLVSIMEPVANKTPLAITDRPGEALFVTLFMKCGCAPEIRRVCR